MFLGAVSSSLLKLYRYRQASNYTAERLIGNMVPDFLALQSNGLVFSSYRGSIGVPSVNQPPARSQDTDVSDEDVDLCAFSLLCIDCIQSRDHEKLDLMEITSNFLTHSYMSVSC